MEAQSLFMLISERLLLYSDQIGVPTYNAMYEIMVEMPCTQVLRKPHQDPTPNTFISNPGSTNLTGLVLGQLTKILFSIVYFVSIVKYCIESDK